MSTKQTTSKKGHAEQQAESSNTQELTPIEKQLLECAESGTPVLLYGGDDPDGRKKLIYEIHKRAMQTDAPTYTKDPSVPPVPQKSFKMVINSATKQYYINCGSMDGREIEETIKNVYCNTDKLTEAEISYPFPFTEDSSPVPVVNTDYARRLFFLDNVSYDSQDKKYFCSSAKIIKKGQSGKWIVVYTYNFDSLLQYFSEQFEPVCLDPEKQDIPQAKTESEDSNIKNETLFFDDDTNYLWFSNDRKTRIEGEDVKLIMAMLDMTKKKNRRSCRKEEIILNAYRIEVGINQKIPDKIGKKLNTSKSTINKKCKLDLNIKELIQKDGVKLLKFSINVERRKL